MLMPSLLNNSLWNDFFDDDWFERRPAAPDRKPRNERPAYRLMNTDVKETDENYELEMDLPGYSKDDVTAKLENGYMTIEAQKTVDNDEKDEKSGKYIRRERYTGSCRRSFYVGDAISEQDIKASFKDGILTVVIPKEAPKEVEQSRLIAIEG